MGEVLTGRLQSLDWTGRLDWWTGLVDWTGGLDWWTGLVDWTGGLDWWTDTKNHFYAPNKTYSPVGLHVVSCPAYFHTMRGKISWARG